MIAGAVAIFYHARGDPADMPRCAVLVSLRRAALFSLGSVALGSFLVALLQFVRWLLAWVDRRTKWLQGHGVPPCKRGAWYTKMSVSVLLPRDAGLTEPGMR